MAVPQRHDNPPGQMPPREQDVPSLFSDFDLYLFGQGKHYHLYEKMGTHPRTVNGVEGVNFAVWAPNARAVSVIGNFNGWRHDANHLHLCHIDLGVWECFIPWLRSGELYKYAISSRYNNSVVEKADPYRFAAELRPKTTSVVSDTNRHQWEDKIWMQERAQRQQLSSPISIYEIHLGSWRRVIEPSGENRLMTYHELAYSLAPYVKKLGFTHVELMPITEYPYDGSWGYQVVNYFAPTSRYGSPEDFQSFVEYLHQQGIGILLDWVPSHFPKDEYALSYFDGTHLYEYADPRKGEHKEWGTYVFDYGRPEVRNFLIASALFWLREYHIDGLRVDAVASMLYLDYSRKAGEWLPNRYGGREHLEAIDFLRQLNEAVYAEQPGTLTFAEESTAWPMVTRPTYMGGLGFSLKWNMGWMHDVLDYMNLDPIYRRYHQNDITFALIYAYTENFVLPLSHDEVVYGKSSLLSKMPGDAWQKFANLRVLFGFMWGHDAHHTRLLDFVRDLNQLYLQEPALSALDYDSGGFLWIDVHDSDNSVVSFMRKSNNQQETLVFVCNFTPMTRFGYRLGVPYAGEYYEVINSDATRYGGGGVENTQLMPSGQIPWQSCPHSILLTLPPLASVILKRRTLSPRDRDPYIPS